MTVVYTYFFEGKEGEGEGKRKERRKEYGVKRRGGGRLKSGERRGEEGE